MITAVAAGLAMIALAVTAPLGALTGLVIIVLGAVGASQLEIDMTH